MKLLRREALSLRISRTVLVLALAPMLAIPVAASAQQLVRMTSGESVSVMPGGSAFRLGERRPNPPPAGISLETGSGDVVTRICCPDTRSTMQSTCVTERQVRNGSSQSEVLSRYGPPRSSSPSQLVYPGLVLELEQARVVRICVVPRASAR